jgi:hypothetical protein
MHVLDLFNDKERKFLNGGPLEEAEVKTGMSRAAKGHEKYGKKGMQALAKAGREGAGEKKLDAIRDRHDKYDESVAGPENCWPGHRKVGTKPGTGRNAGKRVNDCEKIKEDDVAEATGDVKFDKILKGITNKKQVAKQQKADTKQQARDAFGNMFGGGNPADKLGIRKKDVGEGTENPYGYRKGQTVKLNNGQQGRVIDIFDDSIEVLLVGGRTVTVDFRDAQVIGEGMLDNPGEPDSPVAQAIVRRILLQRTDLLAKYGPNQVSAAVDEVADFVGDVDEIGSSDVSGWVRHVEQMLGNMQEQGMAEGEYDSRKPFGVRYKVFAGREGRVTTKEYWTTSSEKLEKAVAKIEALGNFYEIDGYSYPKEKQGMAEGSTTRGGFGGSAGQAQHEIEWLKKKISSLPPTKEKQIRDLQRQIRERELAIAFQKKGVAEGLTDLVQIEYWQQDTMESGRWIKTKPIPRATAEKIVGSFERGEIVDVEQGVAEEGYGNHPSQRVDPRTGKKYVPPKSPLGQGVAEGAYSTNRLIDKRHLLQKQLIITNDSTERQRIKDQILAIDNDLAATVSDNKDLTRSELEFFARANHDSKTGLAIDRTVPGRTVAKLSNRSPRAYNSKVGSIKTTPNTGRNITQPGQTGRTQPKFDSDGGITEQGVAKVDTEQKPRIRKYSKMRPDGSKSVRYEVLDYQGRRVSGQGPEGFDDPKNAKEFYYRNYDKLQAPVDESEYKGPNGPEGINRSTAGRTIAKKRSRTTSSAGPWATSTPITLPTLNHDDHNRYDDEENMPDDKWFDPTKIKEGTRYWCKDEKRWKDNK